MLDIKIHRTILLQILKDIYTDISISSVLGFKGGTACSLFYELPRFSVDLDFDLLNTEKGTMVFERIDGILKNYGEIKERIDKRFTIFFVLSYKEEAQNIKVEISKRDFGSNYEIRNYLGISMLVMEKQDIFAHKLVALLERKQPANRDLFDLWFFLKNNWEINANIVKKRTGMEVKEHTGKCINFIEKLDTRHILSGMGELLEEKQKAWVKKNLKVELLFLLKVRLKNL